MAKAPPPPAADEEYEEEARPSSKKYREVARRYARPRIIVVAVLLLGLPFLLPYFLRELPKLTEQPGYRLSRSQIELTVPPAWVPAAFTKQVFERSQMPEDLSILDDDLVTNVAAAFAAHPWVKRVVTVEKSYPAAVKVILEYRKPAAMIQVTNGLYPVDENGVLLPPEDFSAKEALKFPIVQQIQSRPQRPAGEPWQDPAVQAAAKLGAYLSAAWPGLQLRSILAPAETAASADQVQFELLSRGGSRIAWGRAPGSDYPGELTADQKLGRLHNYLERFGTFDPPHGPYAIDIRHWQEITRRPLNATYTTERSGYYRR